MAVSLDVDTVQVFGPSPVGSYSEDIIGFEKLDKLLGRNENFIGNGGYLSSKVLNGLNLDSMTPRIRGKHETINRNPSNVDILFLVICG